MPMDDQDDAILKLVRERAETKRRRAALGYELRIAGKSLYDIGGALKHTSIRRIGTGIDRLLPKLRSAHDICELSRVRASLEELKEVELRLAQLDRIASQLGIE